MKTNIAQQPLLQRIPYYASLAFLVYMPFHIFLAQSLSLITGGLSVWKVGKDALLAAITMFVICTVWGMGRATRWFRILVGFLFAYAFLHLVVWAGHIDVYRPSAILGLAYNLRLLCFGIVGFGTVLLLPKIRTSSVVKVVLVVATVVAGLGIAQYFLPSDLLTHFGYSLQRGVRPAFFIDDRPDFPRVMSTLRDPNSLGAYLIVPLAFVTAYILRPASFRRRAVLASMGLMQLAALWLTFSRSALAAALLAMGLVVWFQYREWLLRMARRWWPVVAAAVLLAGFGVYAARNTYVEKSVISHRTGAPKAEYDSNGFHWYFVKRGVQGIVHNPIGHGPGTAGLASIQNPKGSFLTENYYVQIGYEVGVLGLAVFVAFQAWLYMRLLRARHELLTNVLLATFWAYVAMNMLLHTWSNEAVACQWWLLAGLQLGAISVAKKPVRD